MTADLLKFALEDARSAAVRVQLALEQEQDAKQWVQVDRVARYLGYAIGMLERAVAAEEK